MNPFKSEHFARNHPGVALPEIQPLSPDESRALRECVARRLGYAPSENELRIVRAIAARGVPIEGIDAGQPEFNLAGIFWSSRIDPPDRVLVNWDRFENIDRMRLEDLSRYFSDIWYPSADDVDVLDETCAWIVSIRHDGTVLLVRLEDSSRQPSF